MHKFSRTVSLFLAAAVLLLGVSPALAAPALQALPPCTADPTTGKVSGTVVAVDSTTGMVTVKVSDGTQCTVNISVNQTHPIVLLLGMYFGDLNASTLEGALTDAQGCAVFDGVNWGWAACDAAGAVPVRVTGVNPDGTFIAVVIETGVVIPVLNVTDPETIAQINGALEVLSVAWVLEADGDLQQASDQIAAYHDSGMGFGVLVKLYAIAQASQEGCVPDPTQQTICGVSVEELVAQVQAGVGMGQLFKEYGKPDKLGVGHVRQDLKDKDKDKTKEKDKNKEKGPGSDFTPPGQDKKVNKPVKDNQLKGICKAVTKGGKPKGNAPVTCP